MDQSGLRTVAVVEEGTTTRVGWYQSMFSLMLNNEVRLKKTSVDRFQAGALIGQDPSRYSALIGYNYSVYKPALSCHIDKT